MEVVVNAKARKITGAEYNQLDTFLDLNGGAFRQDFMDKYCRDINHKRFKTSADLYFYILNTGIAAYERGDVSLEYLMELTDDENNMTDIELTNEEE